MTSSPLPLVLPRPAQRHEVKPTPQNPNGGPPSLPNPPPQVNPCLPTPMAPLPLLLALVLALTGLVVVAP